MPIPRPKILTPVTFDSQVSFNFTISFLGSLDTNLNANVAAGTYYIAWDGQDDDLIYALHAAMCTVLFIGPQFHPCIYLNSENKVVIWFNGDHYVDSSGWENDIRIRPDASSSELMRALGFDENRDTTSTTVDKPSFTGDYQHGYGWYANTDGQLSSLLVEDRNLTVTPQAVSLSGRVTSQNIGQRFTNRIDLEWLDRGQTFSRAVGYGETPVEPYDWNKPLECWWEHAREGTEFRVYREGRNSVDVFTETGASTAGSSSNITDANKTWQTDPQEYKDLLVTSTESEGAPSRVRIVSHTDTVLTPPNTNPTTRSYADTGESYYILDQRYETYVVDLDSMSEFNPGEHEREDFYRITIPLLRYES